jgi:hypothetical protein
MRKSLGCTVFLACFAALGFAQSENRIELPEASVTAGDHINLRVTLETPVACNTGVHLFFIEPRANAQFQIVGQINSGQATTTIGGTIPRDVQRATTRPGKG